MSRVRLYILLGTFVWLIFAAMSTGGSSKPAVEERDGPLYLTLQGVRRSTSMQIGGVWEVGVLDDRLVILDGKNHRLAVQEPSSKWKFVSSIGNGVGELFYPTEMAVNAEGGSVAVVDGGNNRIQVFDLSLRPVGSIEVNQKFYGLCWWHEDRLLLGGPEAGALLSIFENSRGLIGTLGELARPAGLARLERGVKATFHTAINRTRVAATDGGDVWVAFIHVPLVRRYSPAGELVLERALQFEGMGDLESYAQSVWDLKEQPSSATYINIDGVQLPFVIKDIAVHPKTGTPLLLLGNSWIAVLQDNGRIQAVAEINGCGSDFNRLGIDAARGVVLLTSFQESNLCEINFYDLTADLPSTADKDRSADHQRSWAATRPSAH